MCSKSDDGDWRLLAFAMTAYRVILATRDKKVISESSSRPVPGSYDTRLPVPEHSFGRIKISQDPEEDICHWREYDSKSQIEQSRILTVPVPVEEDFFIKNETSMKPPE
jgi:hypothetical protein